MYSGKHVNGTAVRIVVPISGLGLRVPVFGRRSSALIVKDAILVTVHGRWSSTLIAKVVTLVTVHGRWSSTLIAKVVTLVAVVDPPR